MAEEGSAPCQWAMLKDSDRLLASGEVAFLSVRVTVNKDCRAYRIEPWQLQIPYLTLPASSCRGTNPKDDRSRGSSERQQLRRWRNARGRGIGITAQPVQLGTPGFSPK